MLKKPTYEELEQRVKELEKEVEERILTEKQIEQLNRLREDLLISASLSEKLKRITDGVVEIFDADFSRIWLTKPGDLCDSGCIHEQITKGPHVCLYRDRCLHLVASSGRYTHIDGEMHRRVPFGCYKIGRVVAEQDPKFITTDVTHDPRVHDHDWARKLGLVSFAGYQLLSATGKPLGVLALFSKHIISSEDDIQLESLANSTAQVIQTAMAEEALRQSEEHYRGVVEGSIQGIAIVRASDSIIQFANQAAAKMFGYASPNELVGKNLWETLVELEEWPKLQGRTTTLLTGKSIPIHPGWKGIRKDGSRVWIQTTASLISWQGQRAVLGFYVDITKLRQAQEALRDSEERYRTLVENVPIAVYRNTPGPKGKILVGNPASYRMFDFDSEEEFKHFSVADFYVNPKDRKAFSDNLLDQGSVDGVELQLKKKDGTPFWGSVSARVLYDESGEVSCFDCTIVDITARKQAEEEKEILQAQLFQAQKIEALGTIAGGIAHNFNNLLMGILGNTSLMLLDIDSNHPNHERLKNIEKQVQSGSKLTRQLLGYAREGGYEVRPISLNQLVKETSNTFAETKKEIRVHRELAMGLFGINGDQGQIEQVLLNLYVNASDAMPGGGDLFLKTINVTHKEMGDKPYKVKSGNHVLLTVRDTGIGMDKRTIERVFDPFFTTKGLGKGTGLGLASVYGIVKAHGGYIDVESKKGHGTTFSIYLPASEKKAVEEKEKATEVLMGKGTVLLVDDEDMIIDVGSQMLKKFGYEALVARSGKEAIELYKSNKDMIDMVLLDMVMPDMGGGEAYDRMKEINPKVKVLLSSGYSIEGQATEILKRGCNGFIQKPFSMKELSQMVSEILDKK